MGVEVVKASTVALAAWNGERYLPALLRSLREQTDPDFQVLIRDDGSTDGTLALLRASQAYALLQDRGFVVPEDIREVSVSVLAHRLISEERSYEAKQDRIRRLVGSTPVPTEDWSRP